MTSADPRPAVSGVLMSTHAAAVLGCPGPPGLRVCPHGSSLFPEVVQPRSAFPADSSGKPRPLFHLPHACGQEPDAVPLWPAGADYQDMEVQLRRQKSGFGFRVLGGDEAGQPVSPETREKARMAMGVEPRPSETVSSR